MTDPVMPTGSIDELPEKWKRQIVYASHYEFRRYREELAHIDPDDFIQDVWLRITQFYNHPGTIVFAFPCPPAKIKNLGSFEDTLPAGKHHMIFVDSSVERAQTCVATDREEVRQPRGRYRKNQVSCVGVLEIMRQYTFEYVATGSKIVSTIPGDSVPVVLHNHGYDSSKSGFKTWLLSIVHSIAREHMKTARRKKRMGHMVYLDTLQAQATEDGEDADLSGLSEAEFKMSSAPIEPELIPSPIMALDEMPTADQRRHLADSMDSLPGKEQVIIRHHYYERMSDSEIAKAYNYLNLKDHLKAIRIIKRIRERGIAKMTDYLVNHFKSKREPITLNLSNGMSTPIQQLPLAARTIVSLRNHGIASVGALLTTSPMVLLKIPGIGAMRLAEIRYTLQDYGLKWER